jgi:hypothetical protein
VATSKSQSKKIQSYRNCAQLHSSKFDTDIYPLIRDGFILIPAENFSNIYINSIRERHELRSLLVKRFNIDPSVIQNSNHDIRIFLTFVCFSEPYDDFFLQVTLDNPTPLQLFILENTRESLLAKCPLHHVVLAERAAREALNELEETESGK